MKLNSLLELDVISYLPNWKK